jgi:hypothetical protein
MGIQGRGLLEETTKDLYMSEEEPDMLELGPCGAVSDEDVMEAVSDTFLW